jgi:hypothetical protein
MEISYDLNSIDYFGVVKCNIAVLDLEEQERNNVPSLFTKEVAMVRTVLQDALALTSLTLFLAAIAVWAQVLGVI